MKKNNGEKNLITSSEASKIFGYSADYISKLVREGKVDGHKNGRGWEVDAESLSSYFHQVKKKEETRKEELRQERKQEYAYGAQSNDTGPLFTLPSMQHVAVGMIAAATFFASNAFADLLYRVEPVASDVFVASTYSLANEFLNLYRDSGFVLYEFASGVVDTHVAVVATAGHVAASPYSAHVPFGEWYENYTDKLASIITDSNLIFDLFGNNLVAVVSHVGDPFTATAFSILSTTEELIATAGGVGGTAFHAVEQAVIQTETFLASAASSENPLRALPEEGMQYQVGFVSLPPLSDFFYELLAPQPAPPPVFIRPQDREVPSQPSQPTTVVRNVTENVTIQGVSNGELTRRLQIVENGIRAELYALSARTTAETSGNYRAISLTNAINNLSGVSISSATITGSSVDATTVTGNSGTFSNTSAGVLTAATTTLSGPLTSTATATSTFANGFNITSGCFAINGTCLSTGGGGGTPGGSTSQVQFNAYGSFGGSSNFTFSTTTSRLTVSNLVATNATTTNATSTTLYTGTLGLNSNYFTSLLGNALTNVSGALSVSTTSLASGFFQQGGNSFGVAAVLGTNDSNNLQFETGGATRVTLDTSGNFGVGTTSPAAKFAATGGASGFNFLIANNSNTPQFSISSGGRFLVAPSLTAVTVRSGLSPYTPNFQINATGAEASFLISRFSNDTSPPRIAFLKSAGTSINSFTALTSASTLLGEFSFSGANGTQSAEGARIGVFTTASNSGLNYTPTAIGFYTSDGSSSPTRNFTVYSDGNVGVGTTTPYAKFAVTNTGSNPSFVVEDGTSPDSTPFIIDASGNVGIGTASPLGPLTVNSGRITVGTTDIGNVGNGVAVYGTGNGTAYGFQAGQSSTRNITFGWIPGATAGASIGYIETYGSTNPLLLQRWGGATGIGTTNTPINTLDVAGGLAVGSYATASSTPSNGFIVSGSVGIGTSTPGKVLDVVTSSTSNGIRLSRAGNTKFYAQADGTVAWGNNGDAGLLSYNTSGVFRAIVGSQSGYDLALNAGGAEKVRIVTNGNVGIGTTSPYARLAVVGQAVAEFFTATSTSLSSVFPRLTATNATSTQLAVGSLTSGRIPYATTGGRLIDSSLLTFNGTALNATDFIATRATTTNATSTNLVVTGSISVPADSFGTAEIADVYLLNNGDTATGDYNFSSNTLFVDSGDSRVGIGTNNPLKGLHVQQGGSTGLTSAFGDGLLFSTNSASGARIFLDNLGGAVNQKAAALVNENVGGSGTLYFGSLSDNGSSWVRNYILAMNLSTGNVGIGTSSPYAKLSVVGQAVAEYFTATSTTQASVFPRLTTTNATSTQLAISSLTSGRIPYATTGGRLIDSSAFTFDGSTVTAPRFVASSASATSTFAGGFAVETSGLVYDFQTNRVGIGTASPDYPLSLQSAGDAQLSLKNSSGTTKAYIGTAGVFGTGSTDDLRIRSEASNIIWGFSGFESMRLTSTGRLGIGTTSPEVRLDVWSNSTSEAAVFRHTGSAAAGGIRIGDQNTISNNTGIYLRTTGNATIGAAGGNIVFDTNYGSAERMRILGSNGNVGIGTTTPAQPLHVVGAIAFGDSAGQYGTISTNATTNNAILNSWNNIQFQTGGTDRMFINGSSGNVGVGTTGPGYKFEVSDSGSSPALIRSTGTTASLLGFADANTASPPAVGAIDEALTFWSGGSQRLTLTSGGNLGIGTTTPRDRLVVGDSISAGVPATSGQTDDAQLGAIYATNIGAAGAGLHFGANTATGAFWLQPRRVEDYSTNYPLWLNPNGAAVLVGATTTTSNTQKLLVEYTPSGTFREAVNTAYNHFTVRGNNSGYSGMTIASPNSGNQTGSIAFADTAGANQGLISYYHSIDALDIWTGAASRLIIDSTGASQFKTGNVTIGSFANPRLWISNNSGTASTIGVGADSGSVFVGATTNSSLNLITNNTTRMTILGDGNVGIGLTNPGYKLQVVGGSIDINDNGTGVRFGAGDAEITHSTYDLLFSTYTGASLTEKMRITSAGNVGIGTTTPNAPLNVYTGSNLNSSLTPLVHFGPTDAQTAGAAAVVIQSSDAAQEAKLYLRKRFSYNALIENKDGGLKIGIDSATYPFTYWNAVGGSYTNRIGFNTVTPGAYFDFVGPAASAVNIFNVASSTGTSLLSIDKFGNVGVGTTSPSSKLEVNGVITAGGGTSGFLIKADNESSGLYNAVGGNLSLWKSGGQLLTLETGSGNLGVFTTNPNYRFETEGTNDRGYFGITNSSDGDILHVGTTGLIGLGTTTPKAKLHVDAGTAASAGTGTIWISGNGAGTVSAKTVYQSFGTGSGRAMGSFYHSRPNSDEWFVGRSFNTGTNFEFTYKSSVTDHDIATSNTTNRVVAIGTTGLLGVKTLGGATANDLCYDTTTFSGLNTLSTCSSSQRYKENITDLNFDALSTVLALRPVEFDWIGTGEHDLGFIAEEVESLNPILSTYKDGVIEGVKYKQMTAVLVDAVKELHRLITNITTQLSDLVAKVNGFADVFTTKRLCIEDVCVTRDQLATLLASQGQTPQSQPAPQSQSESTPATITLSVTGNNPAVIEVGSTYQDQGALASSTDQTLINLGIRVFYNNQETQNPTIDTSAAGEHTITYRVIDGDNITLAEATRTVIVENPAQPEPPAEEPAPEETPTESVPEEVIEETPEETPEEVPVEGGSN